MSSVNALCQRIDAIEQLAEQSASNRQAHTFPDWEDALYRFGQVAKSVQDSSQLSRETQKALSSFVTATEGVILTLTGANYDWGKVIKAVLSTAAKAKNSLKESDMSYLNDIKDPHALALRRKSVREQVPPPKIDYEKWNGNWTGPSLAQLKDGRHYGTSLFETSPPHDTPTNQRHDPADIFNRDLVDVPNPLLSEFRSSITSISAEEVREAFKRSWLGKAGCQLILEDRDFLTGDYDLFCEALSHLGSRLLNYTTTQSAGWVWVCRMYSSLLLVIIAAILRIDAAGKVDDFEGGHSYNCVALKRKDGTVCVIVVEPQADAVVVHADPPHHYTGKGFCIFGS